LRFLWYIHHCSRQFISLVYLKSCWLDFRRAYHPYICCRWWRIAIRVGTRARGRNNVRTDQHNETYYVLRR
jgi:hypothetical protein